MCIRDSLGPSNGYDPAFPVNWISSNGTNLWMIWAANFDGCTSGLDCSGAYGFNYRRLQLTLTKSLPSYGQHRRTPSRHPLPRVYAARPQTPRPRLIGDVKEPGGAPGPD